MARLDIDLDYIEKLADLLQRTGLSEIEIAEGEARVRVAKQLPHVEVQTLGRQSAANGVDATALAAEAPVEQAHAGTIHAPMVGTVYLAPEPGVAPFVALGQEVAEGQILLIIEAMKVMNSIRANRSGRVSRIFVDNGTPVEFGEPLLVIE